MKLIENSLKKKITKTAAKIIHMNISQIITLEVIIAALGGSTAYYMMQVPDKPIAKGETDCTAAVVALPSVNVTIGTRV